MPVIHTLKIETQQEFNLFLVRTLDALVSAQMHCQGRLREKCLDSVSSELEALKEFVEQERLNGK